ncbi:DUF732 domain-containing protein [Spiractinospora alimapuensis]|uniref:DUF732 domain-containing protein n=1 Tax=Spiractinospora alimapuensis TaxID=2820884 RepID=UPI001F4114A5|nr:DUF732 domain-containing protein [Spiractinospora alimapuensis]QVQ51309.1 DUF732 domain-containing protein [Spiractinospora alimapuensis]
MRHAYLPITVLALAAVTACGSGDPDLPEHEQQFLDALYDDASEAGSGIAGLSDQDNLDLGYAVCEDLADGMDPTSVVQSLQPAGEDTPISKVAAPLVGHAEVYLCDQ